MKFLFEGLVTQIRQAMERAVKDEYEVWNKRFAMNDTDEISLLVLSKVFLRKKMFIIRNQRKQPREHVWG